MKKLSRHELMQYGTAIISFLIVMTFTLLIFFWFVQQSVDKSVQNVLQKNTLQQKDHLELVLEKEYDGVCGEVVYTDKTSIHVKTGHGTLVLKELQPEGKKRMEADAFLRGYPMELPTVFERSC